MEIPTTRGGKKFSAGQPCKIGECNEEIGENNSPRHSGASRSDKPQVRNCAPGNLEIG
jgi:hypothetical protein